MRVDLNETGEGGLLGALAAATGSQPVHGKLVLNHAIGRGYLHALALGSGLRLLICQLELREELVLTRQASPGRNDLIFSFRHVFVAPATPVLPTVQLMSAGMDLELTLAAGSPVNTLLLMAEAPLLADAGAGQAAQTLVQPLLATNRPFVYEAFVSPAMQQAAAAVVAPGVPAELSQYYRRVKAEELICLFLAELARRGSAPAYPLNAADIRQLYQLRDELLRNLGHPPRLSVLASAAGWSESKLKRLFRQVFGTAPYAYYQAARLQEAARLLRQQQLPVADIGYRLGFSNLSHFAQVFERHLGCTPKKYRQQRP